MEINAASLKGVSNPIIKTALRLSSPKSPWKSFRKSFLARQVMINAPLGCRNSFQYTQWNRDSKRVSKHLSRVVTFIIDLSVSRVRGMPRMLSLRSCIAQFHPKHNAFKGVSKQLCVYHLYRSVFLAQTRFRSPFFPRLRKAFLTP